MLTEDTTDAADLTQLLPSQGVPPLLFGMTFADAREATRHLGRQDEVPGSGGKRPSLRIRTDDFSRDVFAHFEGEEDRLTSVLVWRPEGDSRPVVLRIDGADIDIFGPLADSVLATLQSRGHEIDTSDVYRPTCPQVTLGFNREGGDDNVDEDLDDGVGFRFNSVLLAPPGYFS